MTTNGESEDVDGITNEAVKDIVHAALLNGKGKVYHKSDVDFRKINYSVYPGYPSKIEPLASRRGGG